MKKMKISEILEKYGNWFWYGYEKPAYFYIQKYAQYDEIAFIDVVEDGNEKVSLYWTPARNHPDMVLHKEKQQKIIGYRLHSRFELPSELFQWIMDHIGEQ